MKIETKKGLNEGWLSKFGLRFCMQKADHLNKKNPTQYEPPGPKKQGFKKILKFLFVHYFR